MPPGEPRLALHSGDLPLTSYGLGTSRLVAMGLQLAASEGASLLLLDELEHGLEPYRVRRLVRSLRDRVADSTVPVGQAITTTHSRVAVEQFPAEDLHVVHRDADGEVRVRAVDAALQPVVRGQAEAFLARQVLVCEGRTEVGLCNGLDTPEVAHFDPPLSHRGVVPAPGGGHEAAKVARDFARLGYRTALLADSDKPLKPSPEDLDAEGVKVIQWAGGVATEGRVACDLPLNALDDLVDTANQLTGANISIPDEIRTHLGQDPPAYAPSSWVNSQGLDEQDVRQATAEVLIEREAFKNFDRAERLAGVLVQCWEQLDGCDLRHKLEELDTWAGRG